MAGDGARARRPRRAARSLRARCTGSSCSTRTGRCSGRRSSGTTSGPAPSARRSRRRSASTRLIELTGNRALTGFTAPKLLWVRKHEPEVWSRVAHVLLPKDYVRFRLTGEHAIDAADASGTLLFDVAAAASGAARSARRSGSRSSGCRGWRSRPRSRAPATSRRARSGSASSGRDRCRSCSAPRGSSSRRWTATGPTREARVHVFCHAVPDTWEAMGVMLSAAGSLRWLRDVVGRDVRRAGRRGGALARRDGGPDLPALPPGRAHAARRPGRARRRSPASRCATTAARSSAPCSRASRTGCATRSSCCASSGSSRRSAASPAAARAASSG